MWLKKFCCKNKQNYFLTGFCAEITWDSKGLCLIQKIPFTPGFADLRFLLSWLELDDLQGIFQPKLFYGSMTCAVISIFKFLNQLSHALPLPIFILTSACCGIIYHALGFFVSFLELKSWHIISVPCFMSSLMKVCHSFGNNRTFFFFVYT